ncbi:acetoacetate decarboxylase family protein [Hyphococcus sp.]|uniref:acetoacetate decarboxylase family protein n=1 Tax=Hyphococcus sp. TaxID=2038636 RepID=UPI003CCC0B78
MNRLRNDHLYMMPAHFGGKPGGMTATTYHDTVSATIRYETDQDALEALIPEGFELRSAEIMVAAMMNRGVEWMAGEPYNIVAVNAPVRYRKASPNIDGWYSLVVWENKTTPILPGREQTGIPKIYSEIEEFRFLGDEMRTWAHYGGHSFCDLHFSNIREASADERRQVDDEFRTMNWMAWRHIPKPGEGGGASLSEATLFPQEFESSRVRLADASCVWSTPPFWKNPIQAHIIARLESLPIVSPVGPAIIMNAKNILRGDLAKLLD